MSTLGRSRLRSLWTAAAVLAGAAIAACGSAGGSRTASAPKRAFQFSQCMRANGVPNFPDPDASGDIQFPITSPIPRSPAFRRAQNGPCKKYLSR